MIEEDKTNGQRLSGFGCSIKCEASGERYGIRLSKVLCEEVYKVNSDKASRDEVLGKNWGYKYEISLKFSKFGIIPLKGYC